MKLMRVAPLLCSLAFLTGSSAFANYSYQVFSGGSVAAPACGTVLQAPAIIGTGACGAIPACGIPRAIDPFAPLWQQAVLDYSNAGLNVNGGALVASDLPLQFSGGGVASYGLGMNVLNQAAVIGNGPLYIEAPNAFDTTLLQGGGMQAVETEAAPACQTTTPGEKTIIHTITRTRYIQPRIIKRKRSFLRRCFSKFGS